MSKLIWLDCDPGHDDMLAIILAVNHPQSQLLFVSTSAGNSTIDNTTQNALNILYQIHHQQITVIKGLCSPLCSALQTAAQIHGESGLQGAELQHSPHLAICSDPILQMYNRIRGKKVHCVVTGSLTNVAVLLKAFPSVRECIIDITLMGGAIGVGNWSPAAQFNILVDPQAADMVFKSGISLVMVPLEVTHTALVNEDVFAELRQMESQFGKKLVPLMEYFKMKYKEQQEFAWPVAHDPCAVYHVLRPNAFQGRMAKVEIEREGKSRGRTNCSFIGGFKKNAFVCEQINVKEFWSVMLQCIRRIK